MDALVKPLTKFVIGTIAGPALLGLLYFLVMKPIITGALNNLAETNQRQSAAIVERARAQQAEITRRSEAAKRQALAADAVSIQQAADAAQAEQANAARKQAAWEAFYRPAKECATPKDWDTQVECGNAHIRAKRQFEERWARGEL